MTITLIQGLENFRCSPGRRTVVTVGTFDGVHLGHREILCRLRHAAQTHDYDPILVTFDPHPRQVVSPGDTPMLLTTLCEKERLLREYFSGVVLVMKFDSALRQMAAEEFVSSVLIGRLGMNMLVVGYDHGFGRHREGSLVELTQIGKRCGFGLEVVGPVNVGEQRVSSSAIRRCLKGGDFATTLAMLGHPYVIAGVVERGIGIGRRLLGFPTANLSLPPCKLLPPEGVYACHAVIGERQYEGMMFVGQNHFNPQQRITVEVNFFDLDEDLYGQEVAAFAYKYLRANRRFASPEQLTAQISSDKQEVLRILYEEKLS